MNSSDTVLYNWFIAEGEGISSISPGLGIHLVNLLGQVREVIPKVTDPYVKKQLETYRDSLEFITSFAAIHQRAVIDKLSYLVEKA